MRPGRQDEVGNLTLVEFEAYSEAIVRLLTELDLHPVLVDVGASGSPPTLWNKISPHSIYVGFDPDLRETSELSEGTFRKSFVVNQAVIAEDAPDEVTFFLTRFAACSSTLSPDREALSSYLFADLFDVEREVKVQATTLSKAMERLSLTEIDWLKLDSQGTDLRLFMSLSPDMRSKLITLDIEPGFIDAYQEEDLFVDAHRELIRGGFWLSYAHVGEAVRMRRETLDWLTGFSTETERKRIEASTRTSPGWVEARYMRTVEWLRSAEPSERTFALLWIFAVLDGQYGFALDVAREYETTFGVGKVPALMKAAALASTRRSRKSLLIHAAKSVVPLRARRALKSATSRRVARHLGEGAP